MCRSLASFQIFGKLSSGFNKLPKENWLGFVLISSFTLIMMLRLSWKVFRKLCYFSCCSISHKIFAYYMHDSINFSCSITYSSLLSVTLQTELISGDQNGNIRVWDLTANSCSCELVFFTFYRIFWYKLYS